MTSKLREGLNFNTVLITILLALSGWTLKKLVEQGELQASNAVRVEYQGKAIEALDQRVKQNTRDISEVSREISSLRR